MTQTEYFKNLGAPLHNSRWSWGAVRATDGVIFLRCWQHETMKYDAKRFIRILDPLPAESSTLGYEERKAHIALLRGGASGYVIICQAHDEKSTNLTVKAIDTRDLWKCGALINVDGADWIELTTRVPTHSVTRSKDADYK